MKTIIRFALNDLFLFGIEFIQRYYLKVANFYDFITLSHTLSIRRDCGFISSLCGS